MAFAAGSFGFVEFISKQTFLSVHIDKKLAVQKITPQIHEVVLSYIQPRNRKRKNMRMCVKMIWIIMMNVFIVAAGAGGDRWLMKTIMRMVLFFLFVASEKI